MAFASAVRGLLLPICNRPVLRREIHGGGCGSVRASKGASEVEDGSCAALSPTNGHLPVHMKYLAIILVGLSFLLPGVEETPAPRETRGHKAPQVHREPKASRAWRARKVRRERRDHRVRKVPRATKVKKVTREKKAIRATQAPRSASSKLMAL